MRLGDELAAKLALARQAVRLERWDRVVANVRWNDITTFHGVMELEPGFPPAIRNDLVTLANFRAYADMMLAQTGERREALQLEMAARKVESLLSADDLPARNRLILLVRAAQLRARATPESLESALRAIDEAYVNVHNPLDYAAVLMIHGTIYANTSPDDARAKFADVLRRFKPFLDNSFYHRNVLPLCNHTRLWLAAIHRARGNRIRAFWHAAHGKHTKWQEGRWVIDFGHHVLQGPSPYMEPFQPFQPLQ